jgi:MscS family membrane protein
MIATWLVGSLTPSLDEFVQKLLQFGFVIVICWLIYRSADVFSGFLGKLAGRTDTELDDLLVPYLKKVIKIAAVLMVIIKAAEVFLGMSAAALFGLLGGMGLTLGLVFKDIIANWFGCGVIYIDNLFREGDWVQLDAGNIVDADVEEIGIRSTKFRNFDKTLSIVPNATIANAVVKNWSRMYKRRVSYNFTIDGLNQGKLEQILQGIRQILSDHKGVNQEFHMVNFRELAGNSRVIRLYYFTNTTVWKEHEAVREDVNLKILSLFEKEKIENLAYTVVDLSDDRPDNYREQVDHSGKSA